MLNRVYLAVLSRRDRVDVRPGRRAAGAKAPVEPHAPDAARPGEAGAGPVRPALPHHDEFAGVPGVLRPGTGVLLLLRLDGGGAVVRDGPAARPDLPDGLVGAVALARALGQGRPSDQGAARGVEAEGQRQRPRAACSSRRACRRRASCPASATPSSASRRPSPPSTSLLAQYDDDEEAWYVRAQLSGGGGGCSAGRCRRCRSTRRCCSVNPLHPGANHELVHFYENVQHRPPRVLDAGLLAAYGLGLPSAGTEPLYLRRPDAAEPSRRKSVLRLPPGQAVRR